MAQLTVPVRDCDHIQGKKNAAVTLLKYGDYECLHCKHLHRMIKAIQQERQSSLCFIFRHFPLKTIHPMAQLTAETAEAAAAQGYFWEIHDYLFEQQHHLGNGHLLRYIKWLGLDADRFEREIAEHLYAKRVSLDLQSGLVSGVNGTPTLFINSVRYDGLWNLESLQAALANAYGML